MSPAKKPTALIAAALLGVALALAGCGGASSVSVAHLPSTNGSSAGSTSYKGGSSPESTTSHQQKEIAYAKCLRSHGVPGVREPGNGASIINALGSGGPEPGATPQFRAAQKACNDLLPPGGEPSPQMQKQAEERGLKFAVCMHSHGEPNFPEPSAGSGSHSRISPGSSIDQGSPQFKAATKACLRLFGPPGSKGAPPPP